MASGCDAEARPVRRPRHAGERIFRGIARDFLFEREAALERPRLVRGPGADLAVLGPRGEIGIGLGVAHRHHGAAHANLAPQRFPVEAQGRLRDWRTAPRPSRFRDWCRTRSRRDRRPSTAPSARRAARSYRPSQAPSRPDRSTSRCIASANHSLEQRDGFVGRRNIGVVVHADAKSRASPFDKLRVRPSC